MVGASLAALALPAAARASLSQASAHKTRHVVLVAFAGGARTRETFGLPGNVPTLEAMAKDGVLYKRVKSSNLGHFGAALSIFTGISEARGIRAERTRHRPDAVRVRAQGPRARRERRVDQHFGGRAADQLQLRAPPRLRRARYGANTVDGDGLFNAEFKSILEALGAAEGRPPPKEAELTRGCAARSATRPGALTTPRTRRASSSTSCRN